MSGTTSDFVRLFVHLSQFVYVSAKFLCASSKFCVLVPSFFMSGTTSDFVSLFVHLSQAVYVSPKYLCASSEFCVLAPSFVC